MLSRFDINEKLLELTNFSIESRQDLHRIPELSGEEYKTSAYCRKIMEECGYMIKTYEGYTGFIADLIVDVSYKTVAFRADMDALEMDDLTENDHKSSHEGRAHNCGHDVHMATLLTAAKYLAAYPSELKHNVRFIFQMAEEDMRVDGANKMVELGCMDGVNEVYALHNDAALECGSVSINNGIMSSYGSAWTLDIEGKSAHGSTPHKGLDAIREGARIVEDMDYVVAKQTNPFSPAVFVCGMFNGGTVPNAVAANVQARGTIRSMDSETDEVLRNSFESIVAQSKIRGFNTSMTYCGYPAIINHPQAFERVVQAAASVVPADMLNANGSPMTGSEDFSYMVNATEDKRGAFFFLGSGNKEKGICNYLHSNPYYVDDHAPMVGAQIFINIATS
ncbi:amidohydrolase [Photobacterium sanctipauli]|uniref:Amidohydrolase n=1 Tax=Photobacterium sanctipauli TaxID=1342794 RepID=A0A2T3N775_9GAMM|nr:M20 family metallopeptidase [Photobacterium sanctipauli]PSW08820.1 amidohydrolase [Photobacterium sanctipauli]